MVIQDFWNQLGPAIATIMFGWTMYQNYFPHQLRGRIQKYTDKLVSYFYPYVHIIFHEYETDGWFERSKAYVAIERYLSDKSSTQAKRLVANKVKDGQSLVFTMDDHEEVTDDYQSEMVWWISSSQQVSQRQTISWYPREDEKRYFKLKFHRKNRDLIINSYLTHVLDKGKEISVRERQRKLYTNNKGDTSGYDGYRRRTWNQVVFEHPSTFDTLAMDPKKKQEIMDDLRTFSKSKDLYAKIGKAWKRGYLLYGPPGTGKSSMIAAMANLLQYDVYDLELTAVRDNTELRKLLIDTTSKSIIVIEDIDCSLDLTGQRKEEEEKKDKDEKDAIKEELKKREEKKQSEVTLSGLLNFIDGLWSAIGGERLIVFTTNFVEKLDPALIRRGRMDKHVELSYCCYESFKVLANNYLDITSHDHFPEIRRLLGETNITPADVAENLMRKSPKENADTCLERLIKAIDETAMLEAKLKAEKEKEEKEQEDEKKKEAEAAEEAKRADDVNEKPESDGVKGNGDVNKGRDNNGCLNLNILRKICLYLIT